MRGTTRTVAVAAMSAMALLAAGCGGNNDSGSSNASGGTNSGKTGGEITIDGCTPQNPLVAGNTNESCGAEVLNPVVATLVHYNTEDAKPVNDLAEKIETTDNQNFTITIKKDRKFHDGTPVTAKSFVDAWNYTAAGANGQGNAYFFSPVEGYQATQCTGKGKNPCLGAGKAKTDKMTGLKVVNDTTFTIKTTEPVSNLPVRLGYKAFAPQPEAFFKDPKGFGKHPIGAGPYKFDSWTEGDSMVVSKWAAYNGEFPGKVDKITIKIFQDQDAAYSALQGGQIDIIRQIPTSAMIADKYKQDLSGRAAERDTGIIQIVGTNPTADPSLADKRIRQAISMGIDRDLIVKKIFNGTRKPATGWVPPVVDGAVPGSCGEFCKYDPAKAKALLQQAGGYKGDKLTLSYNGDGDHKAWTEATCNSIKQATGINCVATPTVDFKTFLTSLENSEMKGLFRMGWVMDYPSIENFLTPIYAKAADSNYYGPYSNPAFEAKLAEAAKAKDPAAANKGYQEAEKILAGDFPTIPLWYGHVTLGWSEKVASVPIDAFGDPVLTEVSVK